ncbi:MULTISPECIES: hypothetical protein [unclassified Delftia]|uniref:hypothetical protein n=1 Tax=unclassified Delftia TaxID=2613839 RepID=UPI00114FBAC0|nr:MULTISPECIES: hypothetical protein [unclassified Delftia]MCB4785779.1 DUF2070 family protein [Delftia sp. Lp-1]TQL72189.1 4-amino-4-deoxy-L-arabinose transferase-like glycosyltransferase [Delftia sp. HK171]
MNQPTPAIVAQSAVRRLPRWSLLLLCLAYVVPGYVGRSPWRMADMEAFGYMRELALGHTSWLAPRMAGLLPESEGLLSYWLGALAMQGAPSWLNLEMAARLPFIAMLVLTLTATWWGVYYLARTPGARPVAFAFGGEAQPTDYARAMADGGLLALVACLGLAQLSHETTSYMTQLGCAALLFFAAAAMPYHGRTAMLALLLGLPGLALSGAPTVATLFGLGGATMAFFSRTWGDEPSPAPREARIWTALWLGVTLLAAALSLWLDQWAWRLVDSGTAKEWQSLVRLLLWFSWPAWPLAMWTLWVWRRQIAAPRRYPHLALPLWFAVIPVIASLSTLPADRALLLGLPAIATLAAFALPTLRRSISALIDWFTLLFFSAAAIAIWVIWLSLQTGIPAKPAANVARLAPQFTPEFSVFSFAVAVAATLAWCVLVAWRTSRNRAAIWKSLVLPASGATLGWLLLMTLWLPLLDHARSFEPQMRQVLAELPKDGSCVQTYGLPRAHIAALRFYGDIDTQRLSMAGAARCDWMVAEEETWLDPHSARLQGTWETVARVVRPTDRKDFLLVLKRRPEASRAQARP